MKDFTKETSTETHKTRSLNEMKNTLLWSSIDARIERKEQFKCRSDERQNHPCKLNMP